MRFLTILPLKIDQKLFQTTHLAVVRLQSFEINVITTTFEPYHHLKLRIKLRTIKNQICNDKTVCSISKGF